MFAFRRRIFRFEVRKTALPLLAAAFALAALAVSGLRPASASDQLTTVIVQLRGEPVVVAKHRAESEGRDFDVNAYRQQVVAEQDAFLSRASAAGISYVVTGVDAPNGDVTASIQFRFNYVYNGITLDVPESAIPALGKLEGVAAVHEAQPVYPHLDRALAYVRVPPVYGRPPRLTQYDELNTGGLHGEGTIIAVIDSGIDWAHPMFGGDPTPPQFGVGPATANRNQKVIYYLNLTAGVAGDDFGHGTHVAADAAGYLGRAPGADGIPLTADDVSVHGVAPQAKLMGYKVISAGNAGLNYSTIMALEDAVQPFTLTGMPKPVPHVINLSLGSAVNDPNFPTSVACDNATLAGVTVVASAGNSGANESTLGSPGTGRRVLTVGANLDPGSVNAVWSADVLTASSIAQNTTGAVVPAKNMTAEPGFGRLGLMPQAGTPAPPADSMAQRYVMVRAAQTPTDFPASVRGRIALIKGAPATFAQAANNAAAAGAVGVILISSTVNPTAVASTIPAANILPADGEVLVDAMLSNDDNNVDPPAGTVSELPIRMNPFMREDFMAPFSSRGPVSGYGTVKPDVTAPGVNILSATARAGLMGHPTGYTSASGTSFSSPITAGVAALVKQKHPDWTPSMIRAALVNTATNLRNNAGTPLPDGANTLNEQGGGLIDAAAAVNAKALMGAGAPGPDLGAPMVRPNQLCVNYGGNPTVLCGASPGNPDFSATYSFGSVNIAGVIGTATLKQVVNIYDVAEGGGAGTYRLAASNVRGVDGTNFSVQITDAAGNRVSEVEVAPGGSASFVVTTVASGEAIADGTQFQWYVTADRADGGQRLRMPFYYRAARPVVAAVAPTFSAVTGTEVAGNPPVDINGAYQLQFAKPATGAQAEKLRVQESSDNGATWATLGDVPASQTTFDVAGRGNGTFQYRVLALYPVQYGLVAGPASAARTVRVDRRLEADVSSLVELVNQSIVFGAGFTELTSALRNKSAGTTVFRPASFFVTSISSSSGLVRVTNADNGGDGRSSTAAFDYSNLLPGGDLAPGETSGTRVLRFANPNTELFTFTAAVRAHLPDPAFAAGSGGAAGASASGASAGGDSGSGTGAEQQGALSGGALDTAQAVLKFTVNPLTRTVTLAP